MSRIQRGNRGDVSEPSRAGARRFTRTFAITVAVLTVFVAVFVALGYNQGPKLSSAQVDRAGVVNQSGQQLRLFANQAVADISGDQVTVTPSTPVSVTTSGDVIAVQFNQPLLYNTTYTVDVDGVTSAYLDQPSTLSYSFETAAPPLYYLDRGEDSDQIIRTAVDTADRTVLYSTSEIQDYAVFDGLVAVVSLAEDSSSVLSLVNDRGEVESVALPGSGTVDLLRGSAATGILGFTFTSAGPTPDRAFSATLMTIDLASTREVVPVTGLDGQPVAALQWQFVPGSSRFVVQNVDQSVFMVDTDAAASARVIPVGQYTELDSVSTDGLTLVVADAFGPLAVTLADGSTTRLDPSPLDGVVPFGGVAQALPEGNWVQQIAIFNETSGRFSSAVVFDDGDTARPLFRTLNDEGSIEGFTVSPNNQYLAIETVPNVSNSVADGYPVNPRSQQITTVFVDISSGAVVKSIEGFRASW
ncbi:MAG: hypothetical protein JWQ43_2849 [Glaciihabitans sp.]|nr:hypothetical protein [Glaciihabitans sp.]